MCLVPLALPPPWVLLLLPLPTPAVLHVAVPGRLRDPRPDPLDQAGAEVAPDALDVGRQHGRVAVHLELPPVLRMAAPPPGEPEALPRLHPGERPDDRHQVARAGRRHPRDRIAVG